MNIDKHKEKKKDKKQRVREKRGGKVITRQIMLAGCDVID